MWRVCLLALLTNAAITAGLDQGPTLDEWKEGQANASAADDATAAKDAKMSAVNKVLTMLEDVQAKVLAEGETEANAYNEFACFCKDKIAEKLLAITTGEDAKASLEADIDKWSTTRVELDDKIKTVLTTIDGINEEVAANKETRSKELELYKTNAADLEAGLAALDGAIKTLKGSKRPVLLQLQEVAKTVRTAALIADSLGLIKDTARGTIGLFLQQAPDVPFEDYKFHSSDIITTLEGLLKDFQDTKNEVDATEVKAAADHTLFLQDKANEIKDLNHDLENLQSRKAEKQVQIKTASEQLSTVSADLLDDKEYLDKLSTMCQDKKKTWDQRSQVRQDELYTLTQVVGIMQEQVSNKTTAATIRFSQDGVSLHLAKAFATNKGVMEAIEAEAEAADSGVPPSFMQQRTVHKHQGSKPDADGGRQYVVSLLRSKGEQLKSSALTSLASQLSTVQGEDPFAKVKQLIQELVERLLKEAANEATQKGWCDKATQAATQKRTYAAEEIMAQNAKMAELEALRNQLSEELSLLADEIGKLTASRNEADEMRAKEKADNNFTVTEANEGLSAVQMAMDILDKFYKTAAKETVTSLAQGPADDAPDAGFKNFEAYTGAQGEAGGIIGMLDVISSDFTRTISETEKAEYQAEQDHLEFMTETGKSLGEKTMAEEQKTAEKDNAVQDLEDADESLQSNTQTLQSSIQELIDLKEACVETGMSYEERAARREDEIEALKKALCILDAYAKYGPDGLGDAC